MIDSDYIATGSINENNAIQINMKDEDTSPSSIFPELLDAILIKSLNSYSVWTTTGSELIEPCMFNVQGLPSINNIPAMLDGQWEYWGVQQPYVLKAV
jgi:type VI secretion system protein ImpM